MRYGRLIHILPVILTIAAMPALAIDPPHLSDGSTGSSDCSLCHTVHASPGGALTNAAGNANLCQSCHVSGQSAALFPFDEADQALPGPGLPAGTTPSGTSHRWDSSPGGHVTLGTPNTSTGTVQSGGAFTGRFAKTYTVTVTTAGDIDTALFSWIDTQGGSATGVSTGTDVALDDGVTVTFTDGTSSPSFKQNDKWIVYVLTDLADPTDTEMALRLQDGKIMCSTCHDQHSQVETPFDPDAPVTPGEEGRHFQRISNETSQMCLDCHTDRDVRGLTAQGTTSNLSHPVVVPIPGAGNYQTPATLPLDVSDNVSCLSCHAMHDPLGDLGLPDDGTLTRKAGTALCEECHTLAGASASHLNTNTGVLWPGGEYGSSFPEITDTAKRGSCVNCHQPHGYPDDAAPAQDYASLLVENASADICFTCHDSTGPSSFDIYTAFNGATNYQVDAVGGAPVNQRHDVSTADQTYSGGKVACANCHNPHLATSSEKIIDPDTPTSAYTATYAKDNVYNRDGYNFSYQSTTSDLDPMSPIGCTGVSSSTGPAVADGGNTGNDTAVSSGTYTGTENQTYTAEVTTGGQPPTAEITVTSTGADSSGPTSVAAFGTPVSVGSFGVDITFTEGGGSPSSIGAATAGSNSGDDTATSGGSFTGGSDITYTVIVSTGGAPGSGAAVTDVCTGSNPSGSTCEDDTLTSSGTFALTPPATYTVDVTTAGECGGNPGNRAVFTVSCSAGSGGDCGTTLNCGSTNQAFDFGTSGLSATLAVTDSGTALLASEVWEVQVTAVGGPQITVTTPGGVDDSGPTDMTAFGAPFAVGTLGATVSFTDGGDGVLTLNDSWTIDATAATAGDGLTLGDKWAIAVTASTAGCLTGPEPDMITFCLVCHDGPDNVPADVIMTPGMTIMADAYTADQHGSLAGNNGGNGFMKAPWQDVVANGNGTWANAELSNPYAALQCDTCHDGHGSDNIFHLKTSISVRGQEMWVGGGLGSGVEGISPGTQGSKFTTESDYGFGDTVYRLPCFNGSTQVGCDTVGATQLELKWGAFCTFCHDEQGHGRGESDTCRTGHRHSKGAF